MKRSRWIRIGLSVLLPLLVVFALGLFLAHGGEAGIDRERADRLVQAISRYRSDRGLFPPGLAVLVPDYLERVPHTLQGRDFFYNTGPVDGFLLVYELSLNYGCGWSAAQPVWECSFGGD